MTYKMEESPRARAVFKAFEDAVKPLLAKTAPDWMLHHMELRPEKTQDFTEQQVSIRLVLRPIGSVRPVPDPLNSQAIGYDAENTYSFWGREK